MPLTSTTGTVSTRADRDGSRLGHRALGRGGVGVGPLSADGTGDEDRLPRHEAGVGPAGAVGDLGRSFGAHERPPCIWTPGRGRVAGWRPADDEPAPAGAEEVPVCRRAEVDPIGTADLPLRRGGA
ncbi:hypothetical protein GCM10028783_04250 [Modestobacter muralis]